MADKKTTSHIVNPLESLRELSSSMGKSTIDALQSMGTGMIDQLLGVSEPAPQSPEDEQQKQIEEKIKEKKSLKKEANLFNYQSHHENVIVRDQIQRLIEQIKQEVQYIKKADASLLNDVRDIEKFTMDTLSEKPGIYHVKFLEIVLRILQSVRMKVGESRTWMQALMSKKKKRGSAFAARSKKQGTAYSMSQELSNSRSVQ
ncbi:MAG: DUF5660 family protein [bacterium]